MRDADILFSVNVYHHIKNRVEYFKYVRRNAPFLVLCIIDFKYDVQPKGPPPEFKVPLKIMRGELTEAGYATAVNSDLLPYQNILIAVPG